MLKINVSLSRKIHIIDLRQPTPLKARWSDDQSSIRPGRPTGLLAGLDAIFDEVSVMQSPSDKVQLTGRRSSPTLQKS